MNKITLNKDFLINVLDLPSSAISDKIKDTSRWSVHHEIVFQYDNKFYKTYYSVGATEQQDESAWEYDDDIECFEVKLVEKLVKVWEIV